MNKLDHLVHCLSRDRVSISNCRKERKEKKRNKIAILSRLLYWHCWSVCLNGQWDSLPRGVFCLSPTSEIGKFTSSISTMCLHRTNIPCLMVCMFLSLISIFAKWIDMRHTFNIDTFLTYNPRLAAIVFPRLTTIVDGRGGKDHIETN